MAPGRAPRWGGHVWLVGMPGSGKSAVGPVLAGRLGLAFVDLDDEVARREGRTIGEIFERDGEPAFRVLERDAVDRVAGGPASVVATGGGAVGSEENRLAMRRSGIVVHLEVTEPVAARRLAGDRAARPLLAEAGSWSQLAAERAPLYASVADHRVPSDDGSPEGVAGRIAALAAVGPEAPTPVRVDAPGGGYDVVVGDGFVSGPALRACLPPAPPTGAAFVLADHLVADRCLAPVAGGLEGVGWRVVHLGVPVGEEAKTLAVAEALYRQLALREAQREDLIVALGGGATGDLAGFVAATYLRGMPVLQVPTTLLAMVDASIGGKTAVNLPAGKNLVGAFHQPVGVLVDVAALATLPEREFRSGLGEVAKYALAFDRGLNGLLETKIDRLLEPNRTTESRLLVDVVRRCVEIKAEVVSKDERDAAGRLFLNYGHTLGHALERLDGFHGRPHGEAVSIGMVFAARLSERLGVARAGGLVERHLRLLEPLGLPTSGPLPPAGDVLVAMRMDKKRRGALRFVLLEDVGRPTVVSDVADDVIAETLEAM